MPSAMSFRHSGDTSGLNQRLSPSAAIQSRGTAVGGSDSGIEKTAHNTVSTPACGIEYRPVDRLIAPQALIKARVSGGSYFMAAKTLSTVSLANVTQAATDTSLSRSMQSRKSAYRGRRGFDATFARISGQRDSANADNAARGV